MRNEVSSRFKLKIVWLLKRAPTALRTIIALLVCPVYVIYLSRRVKMSSPGRSARTIIGVNDTAPEHATHADANREHLLCSNACAVALSPKLASNAEAMLHLLEDTIHKIRQHYTTDWSNILPPDLRSDKSPRYSQLRADVFYTGMKVPTSIYLSSWCLPAVQFSGVRRKSGRKCVRFVLTSSLCREMSTYILAIAANEHAFLRKKEVVQHEDLLRQADEAQLRQQTLKSENKVPTLEDIVKKDCYVVFLRLVADNISEALIFVAVIYWLYCTASIFDIVQGFRRVL
jgi:hypothetical protein